MERIKREILQAVTISATTCPSGTTGNCFVIIPDTGVTYQFVVGLTQDTRDIGFLDAYIEQDIYPHGYGSTEPIGLLNLLI